jgi:hypothetical protein
MKKIPQNSDKVKKVIILNVGPFLSWKPQEQGQLWLRKCRQEIS